ncbi:LCP family protein [Fictibacillus gelatini]|uniref:LCP family glycopolymer transferase n=1 Tax=Fictibacillus gelatini TaxID=225985 RepID=UPI00041BFBAD|nr:LCP family protein [Fictibacillus gelatini]
MLKKTLVIIGCLVGLLIVATGGYAYYLYHSVKTAANNMHEPLKRDETKPKPKLTGEAKKPISILLLGVDERKGDRGRSDTMIVMTLNPKKNSMLMFNIPRDTRTEIVGKGTVDKINHAYAFGGPQMAVDSAEKFLNVPIDYYIKVNMEALSQIVDSLGGITVNNTLSWKDEENGHVYKKGEISLNGSETLGFVRMRHQDARGDFGRQERQRQVISAIVDKGAHLSSFTKIDDILDVLGNQVKTNLTFDEMKDIQKNYAGVRHHVESFEVKGQGKMINNIWYLLVSDQERKQITEKVKQSLS